MSAITLHPGQSEIFDDLFVSKTIRNAVGICSRGWGKSFFAGVAAHQAINELLALDASVPNKNVYIIAPTYGQVTDIYYPLLAHQLGLASLAIKDSRDLGRFWFSRGVELRLLSFEAVERMRGLGAYFVVNDEMRDWTKGVGAKEAWESIIQPCIGTRWSPKMAKSMGASSPGRSLTISTPKGYDYLYDMYNFQEKDNTWKSYHFDYTKSPLLDPEEIERAKANIDPMKFAREYLASFKDSGNHVFYCFDRKLHVKNNIQELQDNEDVHICIDFNVDIQASSMFVIRSNQAFFLDEFQGHPDTETLAIAIKTRYNKFSNGKTIRDNGSNRKIYCYPDPSGNSRKTSASVGATDFSILRSHGLIVLAHSAAPKIVDSVACVNRMLLTADGRTHMYVHPRCSGLIASLERTAWVDNNSDSATIDKKAGVEHFSDGVRYGIEYVFPIIQAPKSKVVRGFNF